METDEIKDKINQLLKEIRPLLKQLKCDICGDDMDPLDKYRLTCNDWSRCTDCNRFLCTDCSGSDNIQYDSCGYHEMKEDELKEHIEAETYRKIKEKWKTCQYGKCINEAIECEKCTGRWCEIHHKPDHSGYKDDEEHSRCQFEWKEDY